MSNQNNAEAIAAQPTTEIGFFDKAWALTKASAKPVAAVTAVGVAAYVGYRAGRQSVQEVEQLSV